MCLRALPEVAEAVLAAGATALVLAAAAVAVWEEQDTSLGRTGNNRATAGLISSG